MGIIQRQTIIGTLFSYLGALLGFIIAGILLPNIFSTEENGVLKLLVSYSLLFSRFANLGFNSVINRLFPYFRNYKNHHNGFLFITLTVNLLGFLLSIALFFILKDTLIEHSSHRSSLFIQYVSYLIPLIFFTLLFDIFDNYNKVLYNAVQGTFLKEVLQRILILNSIGFFMSNLINFHTFVVFYIISLSTPGLVLSFLLLKKDRFYLKPDFTLLDKDMIRSIASVSLFGIMGGFGGILVSNIDAIMINSMIDLSSTGIYGITFYFGSLIIIPSRALLKISSPIIANSLKDNDHKTLQKIYYKSCLNQFLIGSLLFIGIWANIHNIFKILPPAYEAGKYVIFLIGLANLTDMLIGTNGLIIGLSKYYRYQTYFIFALALIVIGTNLLFIPHFGILGAALASFLSKFLFNLTRYIFVRVKFKLQPYNFRFILVLLIAIISYFLGKMIPVCSNFIVDILIRSSVILILFSSLLLILKVSPEINNLFISILRLLKIKK
ncbi:MAG: oligosaccharide flippase family protein [Bacteroidales bacterium]|nr:oligosaccharide flippase family protein [Bacteroidales bacterium]